MIRVGVGSATTAIAIILATPRASLLSVLGVDSVRSCLTRTASCVLVGGKLVNGLSLFGNLSIVLLKEFGQLARLDTEG